MLFAHLCMGICMATATLGVAVTIPARLHYTAATFVPLTVEEEPVPLPARLRILELTQENLDALMPLLGHTYETSDSDTDTDSTITVSFPPRNIFERFQELIF